MAHTKVTKTYSQNTGAANTFSYSGSFDVFKGTEVVALLDNVVLTYTASTINESASPREYTVDTAAKTIHIGGANLSSGVIIIRPETDMGDPTPRATYAPGASITSADLNNNQTQLLRKALEYDDQKLSSTGGTMTGDLTMGEDTKIVFEGATDDGYETTLTVADPSGSDKTITLPNTTGTVITTGDTATVTATMMGANSVDSSELVDGSVDLSHMSANSVDSDQYVDGSIDLAHMSANSVDSDQYVDGSIDLAHMSANSVDSDQYVDGSIDHVHLAADIIDGDNIQDDVINSEHIAAGAIDLEHMSSASVDSDNIVDGTIVNDDVNAGAAIAHSKLQAVPDGQVIVGNGSTVPTAVAISGDVTLSNSGAVTIANDAVEIGMIGCEQTTISDSDSHIPTSGAVVDYVAAQLAPIGGLEVIADDESFPNTIPSAGVVISITDCAGLQVNSSGVSTNGDALDNSTITINGFPSELRGGVGTNPDPYVFQAGAGLMVQSTGSSQTYNYHQAMIRESDFVQLSDDINDFNNRYRIASSAPGSDNDAGDLYYDTGTDKMYVRNAANDAWGEVTSTGEFKHLVLCVFNSGTGNAGVLNGSISKYDLRETSTSGSLASVTVAAQLMVSINGVVQKANTGTSAPSEGFVMVDGHTILFGANLESGDSVFIVQIGSAVSIPTPGDNTVTSAKIVDGAILNADINASAAIAGSKLADDSIAEVKLDIHAAPSGTDKFLGYTSNGMEWAVPADTNTNLLAGGTATGHINLDNDKEIRLMEADGNGSAYVGLKGATDKGAEGSYTLSLPAAAPTAGKALVANSGTPTNLEWGTAGGASGGGTDQVFYENSTTVTTNYTITNNFNAMSAGPITINNGVVVTVGTGETWTIV